MLIKAGDFHPQKPTMKSALECFAHVFFFPFTISEISYRKKCARLFLCPV